ncbi:MAG TPA: trehalose-phosphatase [Pseudolabrys sp.]|nr:trehalose-phosphatase [Pseudolabrys sp.]
MAAQSIANDAASNIFVEVDVRSIALLLDVDGTLIDIGPSPYAVHVADDLRQSLARLSRATGGALALVSGRPIADLDALFAPLKLPAVGGHGAELRLRAGEAARSVEPLSPDLRRHLAAAATPGSGIIVEDKGYSLALHYRQAPQHEDRLRSYIDAGRAAHPGEATEVLPGKAMLEVKRPDVSKGDGVRELMSRAPFAGRMPVFIGDDVTDESVFALLGDIGGKGFSVGRHFAGLAGIFDSPLDVRRALQRLAAKVQARP